MHTVLIFVTLIQRLTVFFTSDSEDIIYVAFVRSFSFTESLKRKSGHSFVKSKEGDPPIAVM